MSVRISGRYLGELTCEATHEPSGSRIETTAPTDNGGSGERFSPTDLVGTALGTCVLTIMGLSARQRGVDLAGTRFSVDKHMSAAPPRRIARLVLTFALPSSVPLAARPALEACARECPVTRSLHPDVALEVRFVYEPESARHGHPQPLDARTRAASDEESTG